MKQVNMTLPDDVYELLVKEAARRQLASGKVIRVSYLAAELCVHAVHTMNGNKAAPPPTEKVSEKTSTDQPDLPNPLANVDF